MHGLILIFLLALTVPASADLRITRDNGGYLEEYKAKYARIRDSGERIIIDGICNGACTVLLGIVPLNRVCVTPRARLGFKEAHYERQETAGFWQWTAWFSNDDRDGRADVDLSAIRKELDQPPGRPQRGVEVSEERSGTLGYR
jgi:hypothetical protein